MNQLVINWAIRNRVSHQALEELKGIFGIHDEEIRALPDAGSEAYVQSVVRLEASRKGLKLWRNNVGALLDSRGVPVRYGLANDSKRLNDVIKSGDLIGWRPLLITNLHVGRTVAQFVSRECKEPNWRYTGTEREEAQLKWAQAVNVDGGDAQFATGEGTL